jgi:hypothetical protein
VETIVFVHHAAQRMPPEELSQGAVMRATEDFYAAMRKALHANARIGRSPKYLFSGLLTCGHCGHKFIIVDPRHYGCSGWQYRGRSVCSNTIKVSRAIVESVLLESIQRDLFTEEGFRVFKQEVGRLFAERRKV